MIRGYMDLKRLLKRIGAGRLLLRFTKFVRKMECCLFSIPAVFLYISLFLLKTINGKKIVFCEIYCGRIGHLAINTELFLRRLKYGIYYKKDNIIYIGFCRYHPVSNRQLLKMYTRHFSIIDNIILEKLLNTWIQRTEFYHRLPFNINEYYEVNNLKPHILSFTEEEDNRGKKFLAEMGIGDNDWFVCFHSRDKKYLGRGYEYHDYRDSDINNYLQAAEYVAEKGGYAIRMGSIVDKPLPNERHHRIIDYAVDFRSDFMDIYLSAHCKFFLGNTAGIFLVSTIFDVPVACANFIAYDHTPLGSKDLYIRKKLWSIDQKRFLTYKEILNSGVCSYYESKQYENAGLKVIENSSDEILELAREMNMRLDMNYKSMDEDEELQRKYISLFKPHHLGFGSPARIGAFFLRKNIELLD